MGVPWTQIHRIAAAEAIRSHRDLGFDTLRPIDPFSALYRSGVIVMRQPLERLSGAYLPANAADGTTPGVLINVAHPLSRQRYTAAHELWHHRRDSDAVFDIDTEWLARGSRKASDRERLADAFASWFLMPKSLINVSLSRLGISPRTLDEPSAYSLSLELGTSYAATVSQLRNLGIISPNQANRMQHRTPQSIKQSLGEMDAAADSWRDIRVVNPTVQLDSIVMMEGDVLVLEMPEIPSSGYLWRLVDKLELVNLVRDEYRPRRPGVLGGSGVHRFVFAVLAPGYHRIQLALGRPWELEKVQELRELAIVAQSRPTPGVVNPLSLVEAAA
jgi:Zn-dependent peptidase ImmA (M78 family)